jgi:hypothetical protein
VHDTGDDAGPAGLLARAETGAVVAMMLLVLADFQPVLDQDDARIGDEGFKSRAT